MENKIHKGWVVYTCWAILIAMNMLIHHISSVADVPLKKELREFPYRVGGGWIGKGLPGSDYLAGALGADDIFLRTYKNDSGEAVELYFAYFNHTGSKKGPHAPQLCWIGSGWVFKDLGDDILVLDSQKTQFATIKKMLAEKEGKRLLLFYCYKLNNRYFTDFGEYRIYTVLDTLLKRKNSAFTLQLTSEVGEGDYSNKESEMKDFLSKTLTILENDILPSS